MKYEIFHNINGEKTSYFDTDAEFMASVGRIKAENDDDSLYLPTISLCINYIREYCPGLTLTLL